MLKWAWFVAVVLSVIISLMMVRIKMEIVNVGDGEAYLLKYDRLRGTGEVWMLADTQSYKIGS